MRTLSFPILALMSASCGDDGGASAATGGTSDASATDTAATASDSAGSSGPTGDCGNGTLDPGEVCDDGNVMTEYPPYGAACMDDCSMVLATCGNGTVDAGEQCDDGNDDSTDDCTTSCTINDKGYHAPCRCEGPDCDDTNVAAGTIVGCEDVEVPPGAELACFRSANLFNVTKTYFAEGECGVISLVCTGATVCPPDIGDYAGHTTCPSGTHLTDKHVDGPFGAIIDSKVCQKRCESDAECRWNAHDAYWMVPGQYRCQSTPDSGGARICVDGQNNAL